MPSAEDQAFLDWFQANDGIIDTNSVTLKDFGAAEGGRGLVALRDLPVGFLAFLSWQFGNSRLYGRVGKLCCIFYTKIFSSRYADELVTS